MAEKQDIKKTNTWRNEKKKSPNAAPFWMTEKSIKRAYILMLFMLLGFVLFSMLRPFENLGFDKRRFRTLNTGWVRVLPDGSRAEVTLPGDFPDPEEIVLEGVLPSQSEGGHDHLFLRSTHQDITVWLNGKTFYEYRYENTEPWNRLLAPGLWISLPIPEEMLGAEIRLRFTSREWFVDDPMHSIYFGEESSVLSFFIRMSLPEILASMVLLMMAVFGFTSSMVQVLEGRTWGGFYMSCYLFFLGMWIFCQTETRQLFFGNILLARNMEFLSLMMLPIPALLFVNEMEQKRYSAEAYWLCTVILLVELLVFYLVGSGIASFMQLIVLINWTLVMVLLFILSSFYRIVRNSRELSEELQLLLVSHMILIGGGVLEIINLMFYSSQLQGWFLSLGSILFAVGMIAAQRIGHNRSVREKTAALESLQFKDEFLANMSHEIRTPINTILGMNEMILREGENETIRSYASDIQVAGGNLLSIINDILDYSRIEAGGLRLLEQPYLLSEMIFETVGALHFRAEQKGLKFIVEVDPELPLRLLGDDSRIREILQNLLDNAIKYTENGMVRLQVRAEGQAFPKEGEPPFILLLIVQDTGLGIREEDQERIFEKFERVQQGAGSDVQGTGLGLPIVRYFVEKMGGSIALESHPGFGSTFTVALPQSSLSEERIGSFEERCREIQEDRRRRDSFIAPEASVLVTDDNPMNRKLMEYLLRHTQVQADSCASGEECLERLRGKQYDMIFLDELMSGMDGFETLRRLRALEKERGAGERVTVIAFAANASSGMRERYFQAGFDDVLSKPASGEMLDAMLYRYLPESLIREKEEPVRKEREYGSTEAEGESPKQTELIRQELGMKYCMDNAEVYREILGLFREGWEIRKEELSADYSGEDWGSYRFHCHSLKTTALTIGAVSLSEQAKKLEYAGKKCEEGTEEEKAAAVETIRGGHGELLLLLEKTIEEAGRCLGQEKGYS